MGKIIILICAALVLILALTAFVLKIIIQNKRRKRKEKKLKEETVVSLEEKQSKETDTPADDHTFIVPVSGLDEKSESALKIEMLLQSVSEDEAAAIPMPIIEKYVEGDFL